MMTQQMLMPNIYHKIQVQICTDDDFMNGMINFWSANSLIKNLWNRKFCLLQCRLQNINLKVTIQQIEPSMSGGELTISISTSSDKLRQNFPEDPKGDVQIQFKGEWYKLQKAHLRLQSNYFKKILTADRSILQIKQDFNKELFGKILECFYGAQLVIKRADALELYPIVQFLEIDALITLLRNDMVLNTRQYNFFNLFDLAYRYSDQILFQKCLLELQFHSFVQIRENKQDLLKISVELFKLIVKSHNRLPREKRAFDVYEIKGLIADFCLKNNLPSSDRSSLKFELIDKNHLNSNQYRDIFLNDGHHHSMTEHQTQGHNPTRKMQSRAFSLCHTKSEGVLNQMGAHSLNMTGLTQKKLYLEMQTTFEKKISLQLIQQNQKLCSQFKSLSGQSANQNRKSKDIKKQMQMLKRKISEKSGEEMSQKMSSIDSSLSALQKNMLTQSQRLKQLMDNTSQLIKKYDSNQQISQSSKSCMESSVWDVTIKSEREKITIKNENNKNNNNNNPNKSHQNTSFVSKSQSQIKDKNQSIMSISTLKNENKDDDNKGKKDRVREQREKQNSYLSSNKQKSKFKESRLEFNVEPKTLKTQKQLQSLAEIMCSDLDHIVQLPKLKLKLLFYAARPTQAKQVLPACQKLTKQLRQQLQYKQNIIIIFRTNHDKLIGAYTSACLNLSSQLEISDSNAYICSISDEKKYKVKKQYAKEAVMVIDGYLICFNYDLMIAEDFLQTENYCSWPNNYEESNCLNQPRNAKGKKIEEKQKEKQRSRDKDKDRDREKQKGARQLVGDSQFGIKQIQIWEIQEAGTEMIL